MKVQTSEVKMIGVLVKDRNLRPGDIIQMVQGNGQLIQGSGYMTATVKRIVEEPGIGTKIVLFRPYVIFDHDINTCYIGLEEFSVYCRDWEYLVMNHEKVEGGTNE